MPKKQSLFPIEYDEVSLVDSGASQEADVLIFKRDSSISDEEILKLRVAPKPKLTKKQRKERKQKKCEACRALYEPSKTGAKETDPKKQSTRAKNWDEEKHPRKEDGTMAETSAKSKKENGKGGTTKAKLKNRCKNCKKLQRRIKAGEVVRKTFSVSSWDTDTVVRSKMERKATP